MPTYTMELWRLAELRGGDIGLDDYPIFDPTYRDGLNKKIKDRYHNREYDAETGDLFVFYMRRKMNEIMPLYNQLYLSEKMEYDPFSTVDIRTLTTGESIADSEATANTDSSQISNSKSRAVQSQFPQVKLSPNEDYATAATDSTGNSTTTGTGTENSESNTKQNSTGDSHTSGHQGHTVELLMAYRRSLMNIDLMILDELNELFINVWDNGDDQLPWYLTPLPDL